MNKIKSISLMFPHYKNKSTVKLMIAKSFNVILLCYISKHFLISF